MKRLFMPLWLLAILLFSCQTQQQYFSESAEIDLMKEALEVYLARDWGKYRSFYSETAGIYQNQTWLNEAPGMSPDEMIETTKEFYVGINETRIDGQIWEMVITGNGYHWVHLWGIWAGKLEGSKKYIEVPVHASFNIIDGKIATEVSFFDNLKIYSEQKAIAAAAASEGSEKESSEEDSEE